MNNEPVAWRTHYPSGWEYKDGNPPFELGKNSQLLYTHPAELTQGEIHAVWASGSYYTLDKEGNVDEIRFEDFARAILRKAQE